MKVVLFALNSSYIHTNLAVRCLQDVLRKNNIESVIVEKNLKDSHNNVLYELYNHKADMYGFSAYIWNINELLNFASELKSLLPNCIIFFGGPEVSFEDYDFFKAHNYVDYIICGEGESVIADFCTSPFNYNKIIHSSQYADFTSPNIFYSNFNTPRNIVYYESSRGCPYGCSYCISSTTHGIRSKSVETVIHDLQKFENCNVIKFIDRTFNYDIERAKKIWRELQKDIYDKKYHFEVCLNLLDDQCFELFSPKFQFEIGIQSTNPETLKAINRKSDNLENLKRLKSMDNIHIHADLIVGLPFETYEIFKKSFNDVFGHCDVLQIGFLKLLKGTEIRKNAAKYNYVYSQTAPYTVLANDFLTYDEIYKLQKFETVLNRFFNSKKFSHIIDYLIPKFESPFAFFEGLAEHLPDISNLSQIKAYELFYSYAATFNIDWDVLKSYFEFDFLLNETSQCPRIFASNQSGNEYRFAFDTEHVYLINRKNHLYYLKSIV